MDPAKIASLMNTFPEAGKTINKWQQEAQRATDIDEKRSKLTVDELKREELADKQRGKMLSVNNRLTSAIATLGNSFSGLSVSFSNVLLPVIDAVSWGMEQLAAVIKTVSDWLGPSGKDEQGNPTSSTGANIAKIVALVIPTVFTAMKTARFIGLMKQVDKKEIGGGIKSIFSRGEKVAGGNVPGGGGGIGATLKGAAGGLRAFANPQILIGAGILAGSIAIIGAGIAGAAWIMGKALPSLAEGLKSFADLDGHALILAGAGMASIGAGLIVMTAGSIVNGLGGLASGFLGLFQEDPVKKLKRFAEVGAPLKITADALTIFAEAMPKAIDAISALNGVNFSGMDKFRKSIDSMPSASTGFLSSISDLVSSSTAPVTAGVSSVSSTTVTSIDDAAMAYYAKSGQQFDRMIELLELANNTHQKLIKTTEDGHYKTASAINSSSGILF